MSETSDDSDEDSLPPPFPLNVDAMFLPLTPLQKKPRKQGVVFARAASIVSIYGQETEMDWEHLNIKQFVGIGGTTCRTYPGASGRTEASNVAIVFLTKEC